MFASGVDAEYPRYLGIDTWFHDDIHAPPTDLIDLTTEPGPRLTRQLQVAGEAPGLLSRVEVLDAVEGAERAIRWLDGLRTRMLAEFHARHPADSVTTPPGADESGQIPSQRWVPTEVGLTLQISRLEALGQIERARRFTEVLPDTLAELERGRIDARRADAISRATAVLPDDKARQVEARVLPRAHDATLRQLQDRVRRAIARIDPDGEYRRHTEADRGRRVSIRSLEDGMASLWFYGSAAQIEAAWQMADRLARSLGKQDPRTLDQRRFDLSMEILQGRLTVTNRVDLDAAVSEILAAQGCSDHLADEAQGTADTDGSADGAQNAAHIAVAPDVHAQPATDKADADGDRDAATQPDAGASADSVGDAGVDSADHAGADPGADPGADSAADGDGHPASGSRVKGATDTAQTEQDELRRDEAEPTDPARPAAESMNGGDSAGPTPGSRPSGRPPDHAQVPTDTLVDAVAEALSRRPDLRGAGRKPFVQVVVGIDTLMGSTRPGELLGHGPIDADTARALAADSIIGRLLTDPATGTVLEHGRDHYTPPAALADHIRSRDQICRGPRCTRRTRDLDHHHDWAQGGTTDQKNLHGYCKHCHLLKDAPGWHSVTDPDDPDGDVIWISPCGRRTTSSPYDYRDFTDDLPDPAPHTSPESPDASAVEGTHDDDPPPF